MKSTDGELCMIGYIHTTEVCKKYSETARPEIFDETDSATSKW